MVVRNRWATSNHCVNIFQVGGLRSTDTGSWDHEFNVFAGLLFLHVWYVFAILDFGYIVFGSWLIGWTAMSRDGNLLLVAFHAPFGADW